MALTDKLSAIGAAIREKTGKTELLTLDQMPAEIASISGGGGGGDTEGLYYIPDEAFHITGDCEERFGYGRDSWMLEYHGNLITTEDITNSGYMFYESQVENIPFELNYKADTRVSCNYMFQDCNNLTSIPKINGKPRAGGQSRMVSGCHNLRYLPEDINDWFDWTHYETGTPVSYDVNYGRERLFYYCYSLRSVPMNFLGHNAPTISSSNCIYGYSFYSCYALDEIIGLPIPRASEMEWTSNYFRSTFDYCMRLKNMTFATNEDGSPIVVKWKGQTIDLSNVGYGSNVNFLNYNSGITADKEVKDDATYQALKDDPDWFAINDRYSRYNHDSAVATINSLPDTSAYLAEVGGTNTIKFWGERGSATDGGAINTLTEEEIAVATAKGWTVTLS